MAFEPSGIAAGGVDSGEVRDARDFPVSPGFAEQTRLFRPADELPVELRALRQLVNPVFLRWAAARAETLGISPDLVVARSRVVESDAMLQAHAAELGVEIDWLEDDTAAGLDAGHVLSTGVLPAGSHADDLRPTIALLGGNPATVYKFARGREKNFRITTAQRLRAFVERSAKEALAQDAALGLKTRSPEFSALSDRRTKPRILFLLALFAAALAFYFEPGTSRLAVEILLAIVFLSWAGLRLFACLVRGKNFEARDVSDAELPLYTILVPLSREASVVSDLVAALSAINYPREKLDIKLILEPGDEDTAQALRGIALDPCFEIFVAPNIEPKTKPKALRAALPFARGEYLVIYDAEDRPHPDQLRAAFDCFRNSDRKLACVQAKLSIDNEKQTFFAAHFRAEYAGLFDVLLPALHKLGLPIPLGGTSNHFRTSVLREVGAWDPHNVTEDADLGVRLARFGYETGVVDSTTFEEAPEALRGWLPQRTRWMKGWLQTYIVHMRHPVRLLKDLKWHGFAAFQILIGGSVLAALAHPVFVVLLLTDAFLGSLVAPTGSFTQTTQKALWIFTLLSGYFSSGLLAFAGMRRRFSAASIGVVLTIPVYWLFLSAAAWRALWKLITAPYHWEKTAHGVAQRSAPDTP